MCVISIKKKFIINIKYISLILSHCHHNFHQHHFQQNKNPLNKININTRGVKKSFNTFGWLKFISRAQKNRGEKKFICNEITNLTILILLFIFFDCKNVINEWVCLSSVYVVKCFKEKCYSNIENDNDELWVSIMQSNVKSEIVR